MPVLHRRAAPRAARSLAVPLCATAFITLAAPQAAAHTDLESSTPADGATLEQMPGSLTLTFSDQMDQKYAQVALTRPDGQPAPADTPKVSGKQVSLGLQASGLPGTYTVGYRVVSADGHPVSGSYTFTVKQAAGPSPAPTPSTTPPPPPAAGAPSPSPAPHREAGGSAMPAVLGFGVGLVVVIGAVIFTVRRNRTGRGE